MAAQRCKYKTKQRELVAEHLAEKSDRYLSVDDVWSGILADGGSVGRSTVYRYLESMFAEGIVLKATAPGGEARYRLAGKMESGQLICLGCGAAYPLECHMISDFSAHVLDHHGFRIDNARTVLYGLCATCLESAS